MGATQIEWADYVWNPVVGCTHVSAGCDHCYAVQMTRRLEGITKAAGIGHSLRSKASQYVGLTSRNGKGEWHFNGVVRCIEAELDRPFTWKQPRRIFVNSMSDLFHPAVPFDFIDRVFAVMALTPHLTYQILTKRPERMANYLATKASIDEWSAAFDPLLAKHIQGDAEKTYHACQVVRHCFGHWARWLLPNVWIGTSAEDQTTAEKRIPQLLDCPAAVRFVSCEPLLGPIDLDILRVRDNPSGSTLDALGGVVQFSDGGGITTGHRLINWVIVGGESGKGARPMHPNWVRQIRDDCQAAGVPFFFKQWGAWAPDCLCGVGRGRNPHRSVPRPQPGPAGVMFRCGKSYAGCDLDGRVHHEFPQTMVNNE